MQVGKQGQQHLRMFCTEELQDNVGRVLGSVGELLHDALGGDDLDGDVDMDEAWDETLDDAGQFLRGSHGL